MVGQMADPQSVEYAVVALLERVDALRRGGGGGGGGGGPCGTSPYPAPRPTVQAELRTLEFWRATISECLATFFLVFVVCGAGAGASGGAGAGGATHNNGALLATALAAGFCMATLYQCFGHISGAHANPAVTAAMAVTRSITPLRALMFVTAQCGGGIAGAALLY
ncbi:Neurogenic protein big brain, partial [Frankliniella fusca]